MFAVLLFNYVVWLFSDKTDKKKLLFLLVLQKDYKSFKQINKLKKKTFLNSIILLLIIALKFTV